MRFYIDFNDGVMKVRSLCLSLLSVLLLSSCAELKTPPMSLSTPTLPFVPKTATPPVPKWIFTPQTYIPRADEIIQGDTFTVVQYFKQNHAPEDFMYLINNTKTHQKYGIVVHVKNITSPTFSPEKDEYDWYLGSPDTQMQQALKNILNRTPNCI